MQNNNNTQYIPKKLGGGYPFPVNDIDLQILECLRGNILVKSANVKHNYSREHLEELIKCEEDPTYFIKTYCRITSVDSGIIPFEVFPYQEEIIKEFYNERFLTVAIHRQGGKCVSKNTFINIKNKTTGDEYYLPIGEYHQFIKDKTHDIRKFKLSRKDYIDLSKLNFNNK